MTTIQIDRPMAVRRLRLLAAALTAVTVYKFLAIAVAVALEEGWQPQYLPWGFLVVISGPFLVAALLIGRFPRSGAALLMVAALGLRRADRSVRDELAAQFAPALLSVRLVDELERSRERLLAARCDEREHLRHDLHDTLSPALNGMRLAVTAARGMLRDDPERADDLLASVSDTTDETTESIRRMLSRLRSDPVHDGDDVAAAVSRSVAQVARAGGLTVEVRADIAVPVLPPEITEAVYRIAVRRRSWTGLGPCSRTAGPAARESARRHCRRAVGCP
jgi:signal transduction histidine kinase